MIPGCILLGVLVLAIVYEIGKTNGRRECWKDSCTFQEFENIKKRMK